MAHKAIVHYQAALGSINSERAAFELSKLALFTNDQELALQVLRGFLDSPELEEEARVSLLKHSNRFEAVPDRVLSTVLPGADENSLLSILRDKELVRYCMRTEHYERAIHLLKKVLRQEPSLGECWRDLGIACYRSQNPQRLNLGVIALREAERLGFNDNELKETKGRSLYLLSQYRESYELLKEA
jgi:tetratricopeptide (TPR) repeat protein